MDVPKNIDAEEYVIGAIILDEKSYYKIKDIIKYDDFYKTIHRKIFQAIENLYKKDIQLDLITLVEELKRLGILEEIGGASYLSDLIIKVPTASNIKTHAKIVKDKSIKRKIINICTENLERAKEDKDSAKNLLTDVISNFSDINRIGNNSSDRVVKWLSEFNDREKDRRKNLLTDKNEGILTYISDEETDLDNLMSGGFKKGRLSCLVADSKKGKSTFATHVQFVTLMQEKKVLHIFHEGSLIDISTKLDSRFYNIPFNRMINVERTEKEQEFIKRKHHQFMKRKTDNVMIKYFPPGTTSVNDIKQLCRYLRDVENWIPDIIIDDYPDYMVSNNRKLTNTKERIDAIYDEFIAMSNNLFDDDDISVAVLVFSQTKAEFIGEKPTKQSAGASIGKLQKVAHLLGLYNIEDDADSDIPILRLNMIASRFGKEDDEIILYPDMERNIITRRIVD